MLFIYYTLEFFLHRTELLKLFVLCYVSKIKRISFDNKNSFYMIFKGFICNQISINLFQVKKTTGVIIFQNNSKLFFYTLVNILFKINS